MGKRQIYGDRTPNGNRRSWLVLGWFCVACAAEPSAAPVPAWPEEEPPEYPDVAPPSPKSDPGVEGNTPDVNSSGSSSPLATGYQAHAAVQQLVGKATYYADSLAGNKTASGEVYRPKLFTAAHKTLPFGTVVRVIRTDSQKVTYVKVNDRGPFGNRDRIIDLSKAAAKDLGMLRAGVVPVRVEVLELPDSK